MSTLSELSASRVAAGRAAAANDPAALRAAFARIRELFAAARDRRHAAYEAMVAAGPIVVAGIKQWHPALEHALERERAIVVAMWGIDGEAWLDAPDGREDELQAMIQRELPGLPCSRRGTGTRDCAPQLLIPASWIREARSIRDVLL